MKTITNVFNAVNGKFGKKVLKDNYRTAWMIMTYGTIIVLIFKFVILPILNWWQGVVSMLNYIIWG